MTTKKTIRTEVDTELVEKLVNDTKNNSSYLENLYKKIVEENSNDLDKLLSQISKDCIQNDNADDTLLIRYYLELTNMLYFMGDKLEKLSVYWDISVSAQKEVYNNTYLDNQVKDANNRNKLTINELSALATNASQYDMIVSSIYEHAYKTLKFKIDRAKDMMDALRKVITYKMNEMNLSLVSMDKSTETAIKRSKVLLEDGE